MLAGNAVKQKESIMGRQDRTRRVEMAEVWFC